MPIPKIQQKNVNMCKVCKILKILEKNQISITGSPLLRG